MKYFYTILLGLSFTGCIKRSQIEFTGKTPGIQSGVFIVKTSGDSTIYGENIKDGKFAISKRQLKYPGYYAIDITDSGHPDSHISFEVYLEDGKYTIETNADQLYRYPKITSPSKIQEQLSAFYTISDNLSSDAERRSKELNEKVTKGKLLSKDDYNDLLKRLSAVENEKLLNNTNALKQFLKQYPQSEISAHLMGKLNYEDDPATYFAIYKTLSQAARSSDDGKELGDKLSRLIKLVPGSNAPAIYGKTPAGKPFDPKATGKQLTVVEFWRASNEIGRRNHEQLNGLLHAFKAKNRFGIVSISLDTKPDWWTNAISQDHMTWPQVSDLKGDDSPNAVNWNITRIPTYYLVDGDWKIVVRDIDFNKIYFEADHYFSTHH